MNNGILVEVLGDYGPFSRMGKSIGYQVTFGRSRYLIDCGAPLFQQIGGHGLKDIAGLIITHCHDDHKRWFSDLALFSRYAPDVSRKVLLLTSEAVHEEIMRASSSALEKSLSGDSKKVIDIAYDEFIDYRRIGPRPRYRIISTDQGEGRSALSVIDLDGRIVGPDRAKIIISTKTKRPRLLFRDPHYEEWVEPESFYPYSSDVFYEKAKNVYKDPEGFTIEPLKSPVWHGVPGIGLRISTDEESLIFSSDTVHNVLLWEQLYTEKREQQMRMPRKEFESATVIYGDMNDYIERTWSKERYEEALNAFQGSIVIHDIAERSSVVHTDYQSLNNTVLEKEKVILTHSPDRMTSEWVLSNAGKTFMIRGTTFFEKVGERLFHLNADVYHRESGKYYVGYRSEHGKYTLYEKDRVLSLSSQERSHPGTPLYSVDLYEDIAGRYFPKLEDDHGEYRERKDGKVEYVEFADTGSIGRVIEDHRERLARRADHVARHLGE